MVATGSHGAMTSTRTIPEQVVSMTIISGDGEEHEFSDEIDPLEMSAARVNLGKAVERDLSLSSLLLYFTLRARIHYLIIFHL